jgi:DUF2075 family protein
MGKTVIFKSSAKRIKINPTSYEDTGGKYETIIGHLA